MITTNNIDWRIKMAKMLQDIAKDESLGMDYLKICACALDFLEKVIDEVKIPFDFPINIEKIVESMGIDVEYQPLNRSEEDSFLRAHKIVGKYMKRINMISKETENIIFVDTSSYVEEQRYALAHGLASYLLYYEEPQCNREYRVMPLLCTGLEEMVCEMFSIFLLIPVPIFLREFKIYIGNQSVPVKTSEWLQYLSLVAGVPYEDVAIGYQHIRYICATIYKITTGKAESKYKNDMEIQNQIEMLCSIISDEDIQKNLFR